FLFLKQTPKLFLLPHFLFFPVANKANTKPSIASMTDCDDRSKASPWCECDVWLWSFGVHDRGAWTDELGGRAQCADARGGGEQQLFPFLLKG
ncbi:hypothetical protein ES332_A06G185900v1, partial [Gossypium tomentosum]